MPIKRGKTPTLAPLSTILAPTDFSKGAEHAIQRALRLPLSQRGATIHLLHAMSEPLYEAPRSKAMAAAAAAMKAAIERAKALAKALGVRVKIAGKVVAGQPFEEIIRHSRLLGADLIVIGRHGRRPVRDMFLGSTAERVIRYGDLPVLVVKGPSRQPYARPIAAVDFGETTRRTLETLLRVADPAVAEVTLVHAHHVPFEGVVSPAYSLANEAIHRKFAREQTVRKAAEVLAALPDWGVAWRTVLAYGDARGVTLSKALARHADLIAIGTHARGGMSRVLLGSTAEWVLAAARCDVLIARPMRHTFEPVA